ncbi:hypothetical protein GCM10010984_02790 [Chishuiella changwenlii]|uniref:Uncharacterized protein n=1 Tax=Chishuiella changwenlii TaxID=1434701 RepID=A0ABQ1TAN9_9FLAO|nr:hypothetical protein GCM10010984_02790 [Chishuiella changwenlii]
MFLKLILFYINNKLFKLNKYIYDKYYIMKKVGHLSDFKFIIDCISYFKIAATPGNSFPSKDSNIAPPPVET